MHVASQIYITHTHIQMKKEVKKKEDEEIESPLGFAFLPLYKQGYTHHAHDTDTPYTHHICTHAHMHSNPD